MTFKNGVFEYRKILIDSDFEPDDKAALLLLFKKLSVYSRTHPGYQYPEITIIAGSSTTPALKVAQAQAIVDRLKNRDIIPRASCIHIVEGSATNVEHKNDGIELLSHDHREKCLKMTPSDPSVEAVSTIFQFLENKHNVKSVYIALREVKDLKLAAEKLHDFKSVDFMGTLSFNIRKPYLSGTAPVPRGCNAFVDDVLKKFKTALCFDTYTSACRQNSTGTAWGENFKNYLKSADGLYLKLAADNWDRHNAIACIDSIEEEAEKIGIPIARMRSEVIPIFKNVLNDFTNGSLGVTGDVFIKEVYAALGEEVVKNIQIPTSQASKAFNPSFVPFLSMMFDAPQICIADLCFMSVICEPSILQSCMENVTLTYEGPFSKAEKVQNIRENISNIYYVKTNWEQLQFIGQKVARDLRENAARVPFPALLKYSMTEKNASTPKVEKFLNHLLQENQTSKAMIIASQYNAWCKKHSQGKQLIKDDFLKKLSKPNPYKS